LLRAALLLAAALALLIRVAALDGIEVEVELAELAVAHLLAVVLLGPVGVLAAAQRPRRLPAAAADAIAVHGVGIVSSRLLGPVGTVDGEALAAAAVAVDAALPLGDAEALHSDPVDFHGLAPSFSPPPRRSA